MITAWLKFFAKLLFTKAEKKRTEMYLYLGQDTVINSRKIVGIFDLDNTTVSKITKEFLNNAQKENRVIAVNNELPKSFVICQDKGISTIYLSQISPSTLRKRAYKIKGI